VIPIREDKQGETGRENIQPPDYGFVRFWLSVSFSSQSSSIKDNDTGNADDLLPYVYFKSTPNDE